MARLSECFNGVGAAFGAQGGYYHLAEWGRERRWRTLPSLHAHPNHNGVDRGLPRMRGGWVGAHTGGAAVRALRLERWVCVWVGGCMKVCACVGGLVTQIEGVCRCVRVWVVVT